MHHLLLRTLVSCAVGLQAACGSASGTSETNPGPFNAGSDIAEAHELSLGAVLADSPTSPAMTTAAPASTIPTDAGGGLNLPLGGLFYGNPLSGDESGNTFLFAHSASRRFLAERTGDIVAVKVENRVLEEQAITAGTNPKSLETNPLYQTCIDYDLDSYLCGYTFPRVYSVGNGGEIEIEIHADDGNGYPSGVALATSAETYVPKEIEDPLNKYPAHLLDKPAPLIVGNTYHIVFKQLNPPGTTLSNVPPGEAANRPRDKGAISLNGRYTSVKRSNALTHGPYLARDAALFKQNEDDAWTPYEKGLPWYEVQYSDGEWTGDSNTAYLATYELDSDGSGGLRSVGGATMLRERFTVDRANRNVDGLWVRVRKQAGTAADLIATLRNQTGRILATATFAHGNINTPVFSTDGGHWVYADLSNSVSLVLGSSYRIELSTANGSYEFPTTFPIDYRPYQSTKRPTWIAKLERSVDSGASWASADGHSMYKRELSILFTTVGGPRTLGK